jgi:hypothetical protein
MEPLNLGNKVLKTLMHGGMMVLTNLQWYSTAQGKIPDLPEQPNYKSCS